MKIRWLTHAALAAIIALPAPALADCYVDYKAKKDAPLRLHYGLAEMVGIDCTDDQALRQDLRARLAAHDWKLLNVLSVFGEDGLQERKASAGAFYLRF